MIIQENQQEVVLINQIENRANKTELDKRIKGIIAN
jgi:hypothetical protein